jgi:hypothetical protein
VSVLVVNDVGEALPPGMASAGTFAGAVSPAKPLSCGCPPEPPVQSWIGTPPPGWEPGKPAPHLCPRAARGAIEASARQDQARRTRLECAAELEAEYDAHTGRFPVGAIARLVTLWRGEERTQPVEAKFEEIAAANRDAVARGARLCTPEDQATWEGYDEKAGLAAERAANARLVADLDDTRRELADFRAVSRGHA